jgi:hypothetical protein
MRLFSFSGACIAAMLSTAALASAAGAQRHLVYSFTVGVQDQQTQASSANGLAGGSNGSFGEASTNGTNQYTGQASDRGTIDVTVMGIEPDGGLVTSVSENALNRRSAAAVTCVVYATTNVNCAQGNVNPEEIAVLRTLSPHFFDATQLDAQRHWRVANKNAGVTIDFSVSPGANGLLDISADRNETIGQDHGTIHTTDKYVYDPGRFVPDSINEYVTDHQMTGPGAFDTTIVDITAQLTSDSMPKS